MPQTVSRLVEQKPTAKTSSTADCYLMKIQWHLKQHLGKIVIFSHRIFLFLERDSVKICTISPQHGRHTLSITATF